MKRWLTCGALFFLSLWTMTAPVGAEETEPSSELMGGYTIEGVPNDHQIDPNAGYFYLEEKPGEKDQAKVKLINDSSKEKTLTIQITNANTNINGLIDYTGTLKDDANLKVPLTSIVHAQEKEVTLAPKSVTETTLDIQMPDKKQEGIILGGVVVSEKQDKQKKEKELSVGNTYSYTLGILLTNNKETPTTQNQSVELKDVEAVLSYGKKVVQADILNPNPYLFGKATVSGKIMNETGDQTIQTETKEDVQLAPHSVYPFQFDWKKEELKPGKYVFEGTVKTKEKEWPLKQSFTITKETAQTINRDSVFQVTIPLSLKVGLILCTFLSIISGLWLIIRGGERK